MESKYASRLFSAFITLVFVVALSGCGDGGSDSSEVPSISIQNPTTAASYRTVWASVRIGGTISNASSFGPVHASNALTGFTTTGFVSPHQGRVNWWVDVGVGFGDNPITVTFDTANAYITLIRPLQPLDEIFNGPNQFSANTHWTDEHSFNEAHKIALFEDGTGRSTTGSALSENAGGVSDFTWTMLDPNSVQITNCPTCSFQLITGVSGSITVDSFLSQIETVGGVKETNSASHAFTLTAGNL